jgi:hypothetical protein
VNRQRGGKGKERELTLELMPVGNALESLPRPTLMEAAYHAARVLWHRSPLSPGEFDRALGTDYLRGVPAPIRKAADQILRFIETAEGKPVTSLDQETTTRHLNLLSDTIRNRTAVDVGYDPSQGQDLLSRLRGSIRKKGWGSPRMVIKIFGVSHSTPNAVHQFPRQNRPTPPHRRKR